MSHRWIGLFAGLCFLGSVQAGAEPYFAAWKGVNCNSCHVNQTGGFLRNDFGKNYGNSLSTFDWEGLSEAAQIIKHNTPSWIGTGIDIHQGYQMAFDNNLVVGSSSFNAPGIKALEMGIKANENISAVLAYRLDFSYAREAYGLISGMPNGAYIKLGTFTAPYGLELADDASLIRTDLGFLFDGGAFDPLLGMEVGIYPEPFFINAAVFDGQPFEKNFCAKGGIKLEDVTLGGSFASKDPDYANVKKLRYNAFGWAHLDHLVVLAEYDRGYDPDGLGGVVDFQAYHASLEYDLGGSIYLRAVSELSDHSAPGGYFEGFRHVLGVRLYPVRNFKLQVMCARMDPEVGNPSYGLTLDGHFFY